VGDDGHRFSSSNTLEDWQYHVSIPIKGNSRPVFAVSIGFSSALLHLLQMETAVSTCWVIPPSENQPS